MNVCVKYGTAAPSRYQRDPAYGTQIPSFDRAGGIVSTIVRCGRGVFDDSLPATDGTIAPLVPTMRVWDAGLNSGTPTTGGPVTERPAYRPAYPGSATVPAGGLVRRSYGRSMFPATGTYTTV